MKDKSYLYYLIDQLQSGTITNEEHQELINYYQSFQSNLEWDESLGIEEDVKQKILSTINKQRQPKKDKKVIRLRSFYRYVAVLLILLSVSSYVYNTVWSDASIREKAVKNIKPGYSKALLILDDGTKVNLETQDNTLITSANNTRIKNEEKTLSYEQVKEPANEKVVYNTLVVPTGGMYQLELPEGTKVWLNSETTLKYPVVFTEEERRVTLNGEAYFEVSKNNKQFIVETETANVVVLGTHFNVSAYEDDNKFATTLVEGKVSLSNNEKSLILTPGEQGYMNRSDSDMKRVHVDTEVYISWVYGKFYFERQNLEAILSKMSRWYNVEVAFDDETIKEETFTGVALKEKTIDNLLDKICLTTNLKYKIIENEGKYVIKFSRK